MKNTIQLILPFLLVNIYAFFSWENIDAFNIIIIVRYNLSAAVKQQATRKDMMMLFSEQWKSAKK